ncbi:MAG: damage-inducible protein DinB [Alphaproteobacteria bacterium]|nr:damage-inducible protein DinB [Alphaproteobacteria bacterium]
MGYATEHFRRMARFNAWANERLFGACRKLPEVEYLRTRPAFFKSIHGTLNHLLVVDRLWLGRLQGTSSGIHALDQELYADFLGLHVARQAEDALLESYVDGLTEEDFLRRISFATLKGERMSERADLILTNLFNHQTHHRGQVHDLLCQTAVAPPELDFIRFRFETGQ